GAVVTGSAKVETAIASGRVRALLHAAEASGEGIRKLDKVLRRQFGEAEVTVPQIKVFPADQLDLALGRTNVIHAALAKGGACEAFLERCRRLEFYRCGAPSEARNTLADAETSATAT